MSKQREILIRPIISEKMSAQAEKQGNYGFEVARTSNKIQIKQAVEKEYGVTVTGVRTMVVRGKNRTRYTKTNILRGRTAGYKKAIVSLKDGDTIDLYSSI
ncbi:MAG: 50S ribosomal protein L23 [Flavobacteriales bacterium]|nr:50S ribosomal protein L23 [Flavobacteriales bacterium]